MLFALDSSIFIHIYGHEINIDNIGFSFNYKPQNISDLEKVIASLNKVRVCEGLISTSKLTENKSNFGSQFIESFGQWRHKNCTRMLDEKSEK